MHKGIIYALLAAALFGASTPFSKMLAGQIEPVALAGLLYLGSGLGLGAWFVVRMLVARNGQAAGSRLRAADMRWLAGATLFGGIVGPVLLMAGLTSISGSYASLLLNMEGVLTSLLAWFVFKENFDRRIVIGMLLIVGGGVVLAWEQWPPAGMPWGTFAILGACLCWGIDNNLTRKVAASDALQIAAIKALVAGVVNVSIAVALGLSMPQPNTMLVAGIVGFFGYGLSLVLFVLALRNLGTARTGAYFSAAPFVGAGVSLALLGDAPGAGFWLGAALMGAGIALHVTERHAHPHVHEALDHAHEHEHEHDAHHQHAHDFAWDGGRHAHPHRHAPLTHDHAHFPDIHHRHEH